MRCWVRGAPATTSSRADCVGAMGAATPYDRPVRVERRAVDERESRAANGPDWDRYADEYQATHGSYLGDAGFLWGPGGAHRGRGRGSSATSRARTCSRSARGPASAHAGCGPTADAASGSTCPYASSSTRGASTTRPASRSRRCSAPPPRCRSPTTASTWCSAPSGPCSSSATSTTPSPRPRGCCAPGGRFAFSITHPTRWMFPDDPGPDGLTASQSYWDRTPYVEVEEAHRHRRLRRAPPDAGRLGRPPGRARLPDHRPARARVARGPRPGLGRVVGRRGAD